jgi:hypothetical protein
MKWGGKEAADSTELKSGIIFTCLFNILTEDVINYIGEFAVNGL